MIAHALLLSGVSPYVTACWAWTFAVLMYRIHMYAQLGCGAFVASNQLSAHPVAPSLGMTDATGALATCNWLCWYGHAAPMMASPFLNIEISCTPEAQYFLMY